MQFHRILLALSILLIISGGTIAFTDGQVLPNRADNRKIDPYAEVYIERLAPVSNPLRAGQDLQVDVLIYQDHLRYGLIAGDSTYELSFPRSPHPPSMIHPTCSKNKAMAEGFVNDKPLYWKLTDACTGASTDATISHHWDFWWDEPRASLLSGIAQWRTSIYFASDDQATFNTGSDNISLIGNTSFFIYMRIPGQTFNLSNGLPTDTAKEIRYDQDLHEGDAYWLTSEIGWLRFLVANAISLLFLGAGILLGSVDWRRVARAAESDSTN